MIEYDSNIFECYNYSDMIPTNFPPFPALGATECACQISQLSSAICSELATTLLAVQPAKTPSTCPGRGGSTRGTTEKMRKMCGRLGEMWGKLEKH